MAASRFCLPGITLLNNLLVFEFCSRVYYFNIPLGLINTLTFWPTAWLAVFYYVEISFLSSLLLAEMEDFSLSAQAAAGILGPIWSDSHLISCSEYSSGAGNCVPGFPWKWHPG